MAPGRTPVDSDANLEAKQHQQHGAAITINLKLDALAEANDLEEFADATDWSSSLVASIRAMPQDNSGLGCDSKLLLSLYSAISNGLKKLHDGWPQYQHNSQDNAYDPTFRAGMLTVSNLCVGLAVCSTCFTTSDTYSTEYTDSLPGTAAETGRVARLFWSKQYSNNP